MLFSEETSALGQVVDRIASLSDMECVLLLSKEFVRTKHFYQKTPEFSFSDDQEFILDLFDERSVYPQVTLSLFQLFETHK